MLTLTSLEWRLQQQGLRLETKAWAACPGCALRSGVLAQGFITVPSQTNQSNAANGNNVVLAIGRLTALEWRLQQQARQQGLGPHGPAVP